jgi:sodium/hydrogen antiporter
VALVLAFGLVLLISVSLSWPGGFGLAEIPATGPLAGPTGIPAGEHVFDLVAVTIALSIVPHSCTDVPVAKALRVEPPDNLPTDAREDDDRKPA